MVSLLEEIRAAVHCSGRTRADICKALGLDPGQMSRFMNGREGLSLTTLQAVAGELGLEVVLRRRRAEKSEKLSPN